MRSSNRGYLCQRPVGGTSVAECSRPPWHEEVPVNSSPDGFAFDRNISGKCLCHQQQLCLGFVLSKIYLCKVFDLLDFCISIETDHVNRLVSAEAGEQKF